MNRFGRACGREEACAEIAAICRNSGSGWRAVCALLEHARSHDADGGFGSLDDRRRDEAAAATAALERSLAPSGSASTTASAVYRPNEVGDAVAALSTPLAAGELAYAVASLLDQLYWPSFARDWLADRGTSFELGVGELFPIGEMRLMGSVGHSARPHRLSLPAGELAHVRRRSDDGVRVRVIGEYAPIIDRLAGSPPLGAAVLLPNESWSELDRPPNGMGPANSVAQQRTIEELLRRASEMGVDVAVFPELSVDEDIVRWLELQWAESTDLPILFAGSAHLAEGGRRVNRSTVLLPGVGAAWRHDKFTVFEDRDGSREPIEPDKPYITLGCGRLVRVATLICKDALSADIARLVADLGVHLLAVPAMSRGLGDFSTAASLLIARSQGATVVANNPRVWNGAGRGHALLGQPVPDADQRCVERRSDSAPDLAIARLGAGWEC